MSKAANQTFTDRIFKDKDGNVVLGQFPNVPLLGWMVFTILSWILPDGRLGNASESLGRAFLFTWGYLELTAGVNYFRRALGAVAIVFVLLSFLAL